MLKRVCAGSGAIFVGGAIYLIWREPILRMFSWIDILGLYNMIFSFRKWAGHTPNPPEWFRYSLPTALWTFGGLMLISAIWEHTKHPKLIWMGSFCIVALGLELGQNVGLIPGTYDVNDMTLSILGMITIFIYDVLIERNKA